MSFSKISLGLTWAWMTVALVSFPYFSHAWFSTKFRRWSCAASKTFLETSSTGLAAGRPPTPV